MFNTTYQMIQTSSYDDIIQQGLFTYIMGVFIIYFLFKNKTIKKSTSIDINDLENKLEQIKSEYESLKADAHEDEKRIHYNNVYINILEEKVKTMAGDYNDLRRKFKTQTSMFVNLKEEYKSLKERLDEDFFQEFDDNKFAFLLEALEPMTVTQLKARCYNIDKQTIMPGDTTKRAYKYRLLFRTYRVKPVMGEDVCERGMFTQACKKIVYDNVDTFNDQYNLLCNEIFSRYN